MATARPVAPFSGVSDAVSVLVTKPIQNQLSPAASVVQLLTNKQTPDDRKAFLFLNAARDYFRALLFATDAVDTTVISSAVLIGTFSRQDNSKANGRHDYAEVEGLTGDNAELNSRLASLVSNWQRGEVHMLADSRSMESLVNAIVDSLTGIRLDSSFDEIEQPALAICVVVDQTGDGNIKVYRGATGTLTGKLSDIESVPADEVVIGDLW
jgi:hypothetical protein